MKIILKRQSPNIDEDLKRLGVFSLSREEYDALCAARNKLCAFCEVHECTYCIVTRLIDDAYAELPEEGKNDV